VFTLIDHLTICVPDLERGMAQYRKLGFNVQPGGVHTGKGTHNAIAFNEEDYLELLAIRDLAELRSAAIPGNSQHGLEGFVAAGGGIRNVVLQSDDLVADVAAMRTRGVDVVHVLTGIVELVGFPRYDAHAATLHADRVRNDAAIPVLRNARTGSRDEINTILASGRGDLCMLPPEAR